MKITSRILQSENQRKETHKHNNRKKTTKNNKKQKNKEDIEK